MSAFVVGRTEAIRRANLEIVFDALRWARQHPDKWEKTPCCYGARSEGCTCNTAQDSTLNALIHFFAQEKGGRWYDEGA